MRGGYSVRKTTHSRGASSGDLNGNWVPRAQRCQQSSCSFIVGGVITGAARRGDRTGTLRSHHMKALRNSAVAPLTLFQTALASPDRFALARPRPRRMADRVIREVREGVIGSPHPSDSPVVSTICPSASRNGFHFDMSYWHSLAELAGSPTPGAHRDPDAEAARLHQGFVAGCKRRCKSRPR